MYVYLNVLVYIKHEYLFRGATTHLRILLQNGEEQFDDVDQRNEERHRLTVVEYGELTLKELFKIPRRLPFIISLRCP